MTEKNLVEILDDVASPINERIDKACKKYKKSKVQVAHMPIIPGVDTTGGGRYLTFNENDRNLKKQGNIITHREVGKNAFAHVSCTLMPWETFHSLCKELKVMIIHPNKDGSTKYRIPNSWRESVTEKVEGIDIKIRNRKTRNSIISKVMIPISLVLGVVLTLAFFYLLFVIFDVTGNTFTELLTVGLIVIASNVYCNSRLEKSLEPLRQQKASIIKQASNLNAFFPDCIVKNQTTVYPPHARTIQSRRRIDEINSYEFDFVTITVPDPQKSNNPKVIDKINKAFAPHHLKEFLENELTTVFTVADVKALGTEHDIRPFPELQPIKTVSEPSNYDPGIVVRYGTMVVILSELFWNLTDVEEDFYARAMQVGESFDVQKYILN